MSMGACVSWENFVCNLEKQCDLQNKNSVRRDIIQRAFFAVQRLRLSGADVASAIEKAVYSDRNHAVPQTTALAKLFWPLVCTTNYDEIYLRAKCPKDGVPRMLRVVGRSDADCRDVLQHLSFPAGELVWALQGFLRPQDEHIRKVLGSDGNCDGLTNEFVVGHAEYRRVAHRESHFRRCFAEVFRRSSLLFLGSGLAEPYFLTLFDEIIELTGPPVRPHFAIVEDGKIDSSLMRQRYHIICMTYPEGQHGHVACYLEEFSRIVKAARVRPSAWGVRVRSPLWIGRCDTGDSFRVVRGMLPDPRTLPNDQVVAISCGRAALESGNSRAAGVDPRAVPASSEASLPSRPDRGRPIYSQDAAKAISLPRNCSYNWLGDWTIKWQKPARAYGIIARELVLGSSRSSRDRRSPEAIRVSLFESLKVIKTDGAKTLHVQLLAAGRSRVFQPWVSLVQMARAYGDWIRSELGCLDVSLYVVDPAVVGLLHGAFVDLTEHVGGAQFRIGVEMIYESGDIDRYHRFVEDDAVLADLVEGGTAGIDRQPMVFARPIPTFDFSPQPFADVRKMKVREYGLVHGSTFVLDYRSAM